MTDQNKGRGPMSDVADAWVLPVRNGPMRPLPDLKLTTLQEAVGGWIELVRLPDYDDVFLFVNEDGHEMEMPLNTAASLLAQQPIVGDVVLTGTVGPDGHQLPLTSLRTWDEVTAAVVKIIRRPPDETGPARKGDGFEARWVLADDAGLERLLVLSVFAASSSTSPGRYAAVGQVMRHTGTEYHRQVIPPLIWRIDNDHWSDAVEAGRERIAAAVRSWQARLASDPRALLLVVAW